MAATNRHLGYTQCTANNRWGSIDAHVQNEAVTVSYSALLRKGAVTRVMNSSDQVSFQLPYLEGQKKLRRRWRSLSGWGKEPATDIFDLEGCQDFIYE